MTNFKKKIFTIIFIILSNNVSATTPLALKLFDNIYTTFKLNQEYEEIGKKKIKEIEIEIVQLNKFTKHLRTYFDEPTEKLSSDKFYQDFFKKIYLPTYEISNLEPEELFELLNRKIEKLKDDKSAVKEEYPLDLHKENLDSLFQKINRDKKSFEEAMKSVTPILIKKRYNLDRCDYQNLVSNMEIRGAKLITFFKILREKFKSSCFQAKWYDANAENLFFGMEISEEKDFVKNIEKLIQNIYPERRMRSVSDDPRLNISLESLVTGDKTRSLSSC